MPRRSTFFRNIALICWLSYPFVLSARLAPPEGTEDLRHLSEHASLIFHARVVRIDPVAGQDSVAGELVYGAQIATLDVDRWYKGAPAPGAVRLKYVYPPLVNGHDCVDLHRSAFWLVFANPRADGSYEFSDSCQGGLPISAILAPARTGDWSQQLQQDIIAGLQDGDPSVRLANIARLGGLKLRSSTDALHDLIENGNEAESKWATYAVLRSGDLSVLPRVASILIEIDRPLGGPDPTLRSQPDAAPFFVEPEILIALELQREVRDRRAVPALIKILESAKEGWVRECAMWALQGIKDPHSLPAVVDRLSDSHSGVQYHALVTIMLITDTAECAPPAGPNPLDSAIQAAAEICKTWWQHTGKTRQWATTKSQ
jgi:hypothetical protein